MKLNKILLTTCALPIAITPAISIASCAKPTLFTISFEKTDGVTLSSYDSITVKPNTKWKDITKPTVAVDDQYIGYDWYDIDTKQKITDDTVITANVKVKYVAFKRTDVLINVTIVTDVKTYDPVPFVQTATFAQFKTYYKITTDPKKSYCRFTGWKTSDGVEVTDTWQFPSAQSITIKATYQDFKTDTWANVITYANQGLAKLKEVYNAETFVGLERIVEINGKEHTVRIIGEDHDTIANTNSKAALTFELVTLLSNIDGRFISTIWNTRTGNIDYTNSILRRNLTGCGTATGDDVWEIPAIDMLPSDLKSGIKTVNKKVATYNSATSKFEVKPEGYNDKLFPLTYTEMAQSGSAFAKVEGEAYKYWADHNTNEARIKKDANGNSYTYWLSSPVVPEIYRSWAVSGEGSLVSGRGVAVSGTSVSFAFCI